MTLKSNLLIALTMLTVAPLVYSMQIIETAEYYEDYKGRRIPKTPDNNLMIAVKRSNDAGIKEAILNGANPDTTTTYSPLAYAIKKNKFELAQWLLDHNADPDYDPRHISVNDPISSPLQIAKNWKRTDFVELLSQYSKK